jgi:hypothetical protein
VSPWKGVRVYSRVTISHKSTNAHGPGFVSLHRFPNNMPTCRVAQQETPNAEKQIDKLRELRL